MKSRVYFSEVKRVSEQKYLGNTVLVCRPRVALSCFTLLRTGKISARAANFYSSSAPHSQPLPLSFMLPYSDCRI